MNVPSKVSIVMASVLLASCTGFSVTHERYKSFTSAAYGFSFAYPAEYQEVVDDPQSVVIMAENKNGVMYAAARIEAIPSDITADDADYDSFVVAALQKLCNFSTGMRSDSCTGVISKQSLKTPSGLTVDEYMMKSEVADDISRVAGERGPFSVFNIGANLSTPGFAILVVGPSAGIPDKKVDQALLRSIRDSIVLNKVEFGSPSSAASSVGRLQAGEGEMCAGIAGIQCEPGLRCVMGGSYPDASGTCVK